MEDIAVHRLHSQGIDSPRFENPCEVVAWMGAVQAQDYGAAKWAIGQRTRNATDNDIEGAFTEGTILRTHLMRPTWHFVTPADIRWILALTAPRVIAANASACRKLGLDDETFSRSNAALARALQGGNQLTRPELASVLKESGITAPDLRFTHILMRAELDGVLCSGARRGKQFTYALLDERAPHARTLEPEEALAELARRYFHSHGPATLQDFVWWSGLTVNDARAGLGMVASQLQNEVIEGMTYWFAERAPTEDLSQALYLLPNFDEYIVGYTDRSASFDQQHTDKLDARGNVLFNYIIVIGGRVVGTWRRTFRKGKVVVSPTLFTPLSTAEGQAFTAAARRYGEFLGMHVVLS